MSIQTYYCTGEPKAVVYGMILGPVPCSRIRLDNGQRFRMFEIKPNGGKPTINAYIEDTE